MLDGMCVMAMGFVRCAGLHEWFASEDDRKKVEDALCRWCVSLLM